MRSMTGMHRHVSGSGRRHWKLSGVAEEGGGCATDERLCLLHLVDSNDFDEPPHISHLSTADLSSCHSRSTLQRSATL